MKHILNVFLSLRNVLLNEKNYKTYITRNAITIISADEADFIDFKSLCSEN